MRNLLFVMLFVVQVSGAVPSYCWPNAKDVAAATPSCLDAHPGHLDATREYRFGYRDWLFRQGCPIAPFDAWQAKRDACPKPATSINALHTPVWRPGYMVPGFRAYRYVGTREDGSAMYQPILQKGEDSPTHVHVFIGHK